MATPQSPPTPFTTGLSVAQIQALLDGLPRLTEKEIADLGHKESNCSICFVPYSALLAEEEMALAMDSPAHPVENLGVTRLSQPGQCGHVFCRKDLSQWIMQANNACPMCRRSFVEPGSTQESGQLSFGLTAEEIFGAESEEDLIRLLGLTTGVLNAADVTTPVRARSQDMEYSSGMFS